MKYFIPTLLAASLLSCTVTTAQTGTQSSTTSSQTDKMMRRASRDSMKAAKRERRAVRDAGISAPSDMRPGSRADVDLKNGGSDRTGTQPVR